MIELKITRDKDDYKIRIGRVSEDNAESVVMDVSDFDFDSGANALIKFTSPSGKTFPVNASYADGLVTWIISEDVTAKSGIAHARLICSDDTHTAISADIVCIVESSGEDVDESKVPLSWIIHINSAINELIEHGASKEQIYAFIHEYLAEHPIESLTEEDVISITTAYITEHKDELKGDKGDKGDTGERGSDGLPGRDGIDGQDYVLTDTDKAEIAEEAKEAVLESEEVEQIKESIGAQGTQIEKKYEKPENGIPESDLSAEVKEKLNSVGEGGGSVTATGWTSTQINKLKEVLYMMEFSTEELASQGKTKIDALIASLLGNASDEGGEDEEPDIPVEPEPEEPDVPSEPVDIKGEVFCDMPISKNKLYRFYQLQTSAPGRRNYLFPISANKTYEIVWARVDQYGYPQVGNSPLNAIAGNIESTQWLVCTTSDMKDVSDARKTADFEFPTYLELVNDKYNQKGDDGLYYTRIKIRWDVDGWFSIDSYGTGTIYVYEVSE